MTSQNKAYGYAITAVLLWSTVAAAFKISLRYLDHFQLLFWSSLISIIVLLLLLQKKIAVIKSYGFKDFVKSALLGFLNPFLYYIILFKAYSLLPAQEAQPLNYTWPIMLALLSVPLLNQKVSFFGFLGIIISFFGVLIISTGGQLLNIQFSNPWGATLALSTAVIWALFWIFNLKDERENLPKLLLNFLFGFAYIAASTIIFSEIKIPASKGFLGAVYIGIFEMGITFLLWSKALELSETTSKVSKFIYLVPFLSLVVIYFFVGEKIQIATIFGLMFIVLGISFEKITHKLKPN